MALDIWHAILPLAAVLVPAILARFNVKVPIIVPGPNIPQVPSVDQPIADFRDWCKLVNTKQIQMDSEDVKALQEVKTIFPQV